MANWWEGMTDSEATWGEGASTSQLCEDPSPLTVGSLTELLDALIQNRGDRATSFQIFDEISPPLREFSYIMSDRPCEDVWWISGTGQVHAIAEEQVELGHEPQLLSPEVGLDPTTTRVRGLEEWMADAEDLLAETRLAPPNPNVPTVKGR